MKQHHRFGALVLFIVPLAGLLAGIAVSPVLGIRDVTIIAPTASLGQEVQRQLQVPAGASMLSYPLNRITVQVQRCCRVKTVAVERTGPHQLTVTVTARQPFAALDDGDGFTVVSRDGVCLYRLPQPPAGMPVVKGLIAPRPTLGLSVPPERLLWLQDLLAGAAKVSLQKGLRVDFAQPHFIQVGTPDGLIGVLGNVNNLARKMAIVGRVAAQLRQEGKTVEQIDVSTPETPVWTVKQSAPAASQPAPTESQ